MSDQLALLKFPPRKQPATPQTFMDPTRQRVVDGYVARLQWLEKKSSSTCDLALEVFDFVLRQYEPRDYEKGGGE